MAALCLLTACQPALPLPAGPARALAPLGTQGVVRARLAGQLGSEPVEVAIQEGQLRLRWGGASFEGQHGFLSVDGVLTRPGKPGLALAVRMEGGKLVGELGGLPLVLKVRQDAANQQRLLDGSWGDRSFAVAFKTAPDAKLQLHFQGQVHGLPLQLDGAGPWQGEQFAIYSCLFVLLGAVP
jgi:hypothetical protein